MDLFLGMCWGLITVANYVMLMRTRDLWVRIDSSRRSTDAHLESSRLMLLKTYELRGLIPPPNLLIPVDTGLGEPNKSLLSRLTFGLLGTSGSRQSSQRKSNPTGVDNSHITTGKPGEPW